MKTLLSLLLCGIFSLISTSAFADDDKPKPIQPIIITIETEGIIHGRTLDNLPEAFYSDGYIYVKFNHYNSEYVSISVRNLDTGESINDVISPSLVTFAIDIKSILSSGYYIIEFLCNNTTYVGYFTLQ